MAPKIEKTKRHESLCLRSQAPINSATKMFTPEIDETDAKR